MHGLGGYHKSFQNTLGKDLDILKDVCQEWTSKQRIVGGENSPGVLNCCGCRDQLTTPLSRKETQAWKSL